MSPQKPLFRTTLSIPDTLKSRLEELAASRNISFLEATRAALSDYVSLHEETMVAAGSAVEPAQGILKQVKSLHLNPFQNAMSAWRLKRTARQIRLISQGQLDLDAHSADTYLLLLLSELQEEFGELDEFLVVTNVRFWHSTSSSESFLAVAKTYMTAHLVALSRGMRLCRIILLTEEEMQRPEPFLNEHIEFARRCEKEFPGQTRMRFVRCATEQVAGSIGHFACIRRRERPASSIPGNEPDIGSLLVRPVYDRGRTITGLQFVFSHGPTHKDRETKVHVFLDQLLHADALSKPLTDLPPEALA